MRWTALRFPWRVEGVTDGGGLQLHNILQGVGLAFIAALGLSFVLGLATAWTTAWDPSDMLLRALNLFVIAAGGFYGGRRARRQGWLHGGLIGLVYVLLVSWMLLPQFEWAMLVSSVWLKEAVFSFLAGALGGILGVAA